MILNFKTITNGKPTYFPEKIWSGLKSLEVDEYFRNFLFSDHCKDPNLIQKPKLHSIRQGNRWKVGDKIHFYVGSRTKKALQFAPILQVKAVQKIRVRYNDVGGVDVIIDGRRYYYKPINFKTCATYNEKMLRLAQNDGFDAIEDFFKWFDTDFEGQLIHWTDMKY